jgi:hypothetical protein
MPAPLRGTKHFQAPEYQPLIAMRQGAATDVMIILEGL